MNNAAATGHGIPRAWLQLFIYLLFVFSILALITFHAITKYNHVRIERLSSAKLNIAPNLQLAYFTDNNRKYFALLRINGDNIAYYYNHAIAESRLNLVLKSIKDAINAGYKIPMGDYYINLRDGVNQAYPTPVLAFAATNKLVNEKRAILIPDPEALKGYRKIFKEIDNAMRNSNWNNKTDKIFWRGATTGSHVNSDLYTNFPRAQFLQYAMNLDYVDACFTTYTQNISTQQRHNLKICSNASRSESLNYKYLIDIDGNASSYSRMAWILYSNSLLFKHNSIYQQWYYAELKPYIHYLPVAQDFKNLQQLFNWANKHPQQVQEMTHNARLLAKRTFNKQAILAAVAKALQDAARSHEG